MSYSVSVARHHGVPGKALGKRLLLVMAFVAFVALVVYAIASNGSPYLAPLAPLLAVLAVVRLLKDKSIQNDLRRYGKGFIGEAEVGTVLRALPAGWRVFHDVKLDQENADHVVISSRGVFTVEVKNYAGKINATKGWLYTHGKRNDEVVRQAWRQAYKLRDLLGVEVEPILVFANGRLQGDRVGNLRVMRHDALVPMLLSLSERKLEYGEARRLFEQLDALTR